MRRASSVLHHAGETLTRPTRSAKPRPPAQDPRPARPATRRLPTSRRTRRLLLHDRTRAGAERRARGVDDDPVAQNQRPIGEPRAQRASRRIRSRPPRCRAADRHSRPGRPRRPPENRTGVSRLWGRETRGQDQTARRTPARRAACPPRRRMRAAPRPPSWPSSAAPRRLPSPKRAPGPGREPPSRRREGAGAPPAASLLRGIPRARRPDTRTPRGAAPQGRRRCAVQGRSRRAIGRFHPHPRSRPWLHSFMQPHPARLGRVQANAPSAAAVIARTPVSSGRPRPEWCPPVARPSRRSRPLTSRPMPRCGTHRRCVADLVCPMTASRPFEVGRDPEDG